MQIITLSLESISISVCLLSRIITSSFQASFMNNAYYYIINGATNVLHIHSIFLTVPGQNGDKPKRRKSKRRQETVVLCEACKHLFRALIVKPLTCSELYYYFIKL